MLEQGPGDRLYRGKERWKRSAKIIIQKPKIMKTYFTKVTADHWNPKNKLQDEAQKIARDMECRLVPESEIEAFKQRFFDRIESVNKRFNHRKPLKLTFMHYYGFDEHSCYIDRVFRFSFYVVKE